MQFEWQKVRKEVRRATEKRRCNVDARGLCMNWFNTVDAQNKVKLYAHCFWLVYVFVECWDLIMTRQRPFYHTPTSRMFLRYHSDKTVGLGVTLLDCNHTLNNYVGIFQTFAHHIKSSYQAVSVNMTVAASFAITVVTARTFSLAY